MIEVCVITRAALGGCLSALGVECEYVIRDTSGEWSDITVPTAEGLRELLAALRPARIRFRCAPAERLWWTARYSTSRTTGYGE